jgi:hypothetical protein
LIADVALESLGNLLSLSGKRLSLIAIADTGGVTRLYLIGA